MLTVLKKQGVEGEREEPVGITTHSSVRPSHLYSRVNSKSGLGYSRDGVLSFGCSNCSCGGDLNMYEIYSMYCKKMEENKSITMA
jgi:hypothetical protein